MNRVFATALALTLWWTGAAIGSAQRGTIPVNIESTPPGATVFVDSTDGPALGTTPLRNVRVPRGRHRLIFRLDGHEETSTDANVRRRRETFRAELPAQALLTLSAGSAATSAALIRIDGEPRGSFPLRLVVTPGRHLVQVERAGFITFTQWVEVGRAQQVAMPVTLAPEPPRTGSILVAGDTPGAEVFVDGAPRGTTPTVLDGIPAGEHRVEVRAPDVESFAETVRVEVGERLTLNPTLRPSAPPGSTVRVLTNVPARVVVDGELVGTSPVTTRQLVPGEHILEAEADGYQRVQQPLVIGDEGDRVLSLRLEPVVRAPGVIVINAEVEGATVSVNGEDRGAPPVVIEDAEARTHAIIVEAPGHRPFRGTCQTAPGRDCRIHAELESLPVQLRVVLDPPVEDAELWVDDELAGPVPFDGTLPAGARLIEVRAEGFRTHRTRATLVVSPEPRLFEVTLRREGELTEEQQRVAAEDRARRHRQAVARSGAPLESDYAILDFSTGWPYLLEGRLGIGILPWLEAGVAVRSFVRLTEFEGRAKVGYRPIPQVSLGVQVRVAGGIGPSRGANDEDRAAGQTDGHPANTGFVSLEALGTLHFNRAGNFTLWTAIDFSSDRWDWLGSDRGCRDVAGCDMPSGELIEGRQRALRARLGGSFEFIVTRHWNVWFSMEGVIGPGRRIYGDIFRAGRSDIEIYPRAGLTYKFGYAAD